MFEPAWVFGRVVVLFDRLVEEFQPISLREPGHVGNVIEVLSHDHGFQTDGEIKRIVLPNSFERLNCLLSLGGEILSAADEAMNFTDAIERDRDARGT